MVASGDWVVPRLNGLRYFEKPVLGYWLNGASQVLFGPSAFSVRLPSALSAGISALALFLLLSRFGGGTGPATLASFVLLTSMLFFALGTLNILDSVLSLCLTAAMVAFFYAWEEVQPLRRTVLLALFGAFCGLAFLVKGFLAFAVPVSAIVPFILWEGRWKDLLRIFWVPAAAAVLVALPWSLMVHYREPDFWNYFFWTEHIQRFLSHERAQHHKPFWYFLPVIVGGALPWAGLFPAAVVGLRQTALKEPLLRFALCWLVFPFFFFSVSAGKLIPYILPCFPPLAVLVSTGLVRYLRGERNRAFSIGATSLALVMGLAGILLVIVQAASIPGRTPYGPGEGWKWVVGAVCLLTGAAMHYFSGRLISSRNRLLLFGMATVLLLFASQFIVPAKILQKEAPGTFLQAHSHRVGPDGILVTDDQMVYAVCWHYRRADALLVYAGGEVAYGLKYADSRDCYLDRDRFMRFLDSRPGKGPVSLITTKNRYYEDYRKWLPAPKYEVTDGVFLLAQF
jgi:4-amino-4-deoxy-L-arabinose transferase